jgi:hypothetical protein
MSPSRVALDELAPGTLRLCAKCSAAAPMVQRLAALAHKVSRASSVCTNAPAAIPPRKCAG